MSKLVKATRDYEGAVSFPKGAILTLQDAAVRWVQACMAYLTDGLGRRCADWAGVGEVQKQGGADPRHVCRASVAFGFVLLLIEKLNRRAVHLSKAL